MVKKNATKHLILTLDQHNLAKPWQSAVSPYTKATQKAKKSRKATDLLNQYSKSLCNQ